MLVLVLKLFFKCLKLCFKHFYKCLPHMSASRGELVPPLAQYFCYIKLNWFVILVTIIFIKSNKFSLIEIAQDFLIERSQMAQGSSTFYGRFYLVLIKQNAQFACIIEILLLWPSQSELASYSTVYDVNEHLTINQLITDVLCMISHNLHFITFIVYAICTSMEAACLSKRFLKICIYREKITRNDMASFESWNILSFL